MTRRTASASNPRPVVPRDNDLSDLIARYGCGPVRFSGMDDALYERRLVFDHVVAPEDAGPREQFEAVASAIRDVLSQRWVHTQQEYDPAVRNRIRVEFLPNYSVTLAERLIPASVVSDQISTAGYEANGTSNMKFMMNGALNVGTRDGATIEIAEEVGEENVFLFGLTAEQVANSRGWYDPRWHYEREGETRQALDLIFSGHFNRREPGLYGPIRDALLTHGDYYMHLADLASYTDTQLRVSDLHADRDGWGRKAVLNVAHSGKFSSDRTIGEYAAHVWGAAPCPVD